MSRSIQEVFFNTESTKKKIRKRVVCQLSNMIKNLFVALFVLFALNSDASSIGLKAGYQIYVPFNPEEYDEMDEGYGDTNASNKIDPVTGKPRVTTKPPVYSEEEYINDGY